MNSDRNKKENRKALKIFIPIIICCGLIGGLIGYFSTTETVVDTAGQLSRFIEKVIYASTPYAIIIIVLIGIAASLAYYKSGARDAEASKNESESDEDAGYELYTVADEKLSKGMMVIGISEILSLLFFSVMIAYIEDYINEKFYMYGDDCCIRHRHLCQAEDTAEHGGLSKDDESRKAGKRLRLQFPEKVGRKLRRAGKAGNL